jgi:hypothetical protein
MFSGYDHRMADERAYSKADLERALQALAKRLAGKGQNATIFLFGGAALTLTTDFRKKVSDIDFDADANDISLLRGYAHDLKIRGDIPPFSKNFGLIDKFIKNQSSCFEHYGFTDGGKFSSGTNDAPGLNVYTLNKEPQLAMKLARMADKDMDDVCHLCRVLKISGGEKLKKLWDQQEARVPPWFSSGVEPIDLWPRITAYAKQHGIKIPAP